VSTPTPVQAEVAVYGATAAGVCAAVAAAEQGAQVVLLEPGQHVGGMTSGGLGYTDLGDPRVLGGAAARFRQAVADHYGVPPGHWAGPEPHVAEAVLTGWLERAGVQLRRGERLVGAEVEHGRIAALRTATGTEVRAGVYVDAGYEGDLLAAAGVPTAVGREGRDTYGEELAGRQELLPGKHTMPPWISPFVDDPEGRTPGTLLPQVKPEPLAPVGAGDGGVMAYGYRACLSSGPDRRPFTRPDDYDEAYWELGRRLFHHWAREGRTVRAGDLLGLTPNLPGGKCDANSLGPFSLNVLDGSAWDYPAADEPRREEIRAHHRRHTRGLLHFLASDPAVPVGVRRELAGWGWPSDEFGDTDGLPHQLYVREARRMVGDLVLTEHDLRHPRRQPDTVALGSYHLDVREVQRGWRWVHEHPDPVAMVVTEGYFSVRVPPYPIPYRALVPAERHCTNLLVPVCVSASHVAFSSLRMEVQYQMLGQAAGTAAALAVRGATEVQHVDVAELQRRLRAAGAVLDLPG
jgi:FAD-dependent oxidoreductase family protein